MQTIQYSSPSGIFSIDYTDVLRQGTDKINSSNSVMRTTISNSDIVKNILYYVLIQTTLRSTLSADEAVKNFPSFFYLEGTDYTSVRASLIDSNSYVQQGGNPSVGDCVFAFISSQPDNSLFYRLQSSDITNIANWKPIALSGSSQSTVRSVQNKTTNYSLSVLDYGVLLDAIAANRVVSLPDAALAQDLTFFIKKTDSTAHTVTINCSNLVNSIEGTASYVLNNQYECITVVSDGQNYYILSAI